MGPGFIDRTLHTTGILLLVFLPFGLYYIGIYPALAVFSGGVWGMLNLIFTAALVRATLRPDGVDKKRALGLAIFKFPLLYGAGYFLATNHRFDPLYLLAGFSASLLVMLLKALSGSLLKVADRPTESGKAGSVA